LAKNEQPSDDKIPGDRLVLALISVVRTLVLELSKRGVLDGEEFALILQQTAATHREAASTETPSCPGRGVDISSDRVPLHGAGFANTYQGTYNNLKANYWTPGSGENDFPKPNANRTNTPNRDLLGYFDGSFLKIRSLTLGYNIPAQYVNKIGMRSIRVYATARDPFILFSPYRNKYHGLDPEASGSKSSTDPTVTLNLDTPPSWSMLFGLNVTF